MDPLQTLPQPFLLQPPRERTLLLRVPELLHQRIRQVGNLPWKIGLECHSVCDAGGLTGERGG